MARPKSVTIKSLNAFFSKNFGDLTAELNNGTVVKMSDYLGSPIVVVNVASKWGATDREYKQLQQLLDQFSNLKVLAFPSNQFGNQEPGTDAQILEFAKGYGFTGDLFKKTDVNGADEHEVFKWLKAQPKGSGFLTNKIKLGFSRQTRFIMKNNISTRNEIRDK